ncbi:hypothetical protein Bca4012_040549 [Brassica carinata]
MRNGAAALRALASGVAFIATAAGGAVMSLASSDKDHPIVESLRRTLGDPNASVPSRSAQVSALSGAGLSNPLDILVIGGGATGSGVALDAATRGLRVGLVERDDFSSGTSSRSTKLIHGGVRYLEKAVFNLDYGQLRLVFHALEERKQLIENAPHLCRALPCMTPCFSWFEVGYFWMGLKMYDLVAGPRLLHLSRFYSAKQSVELFPTLASKGKDKSTNLTGTVVYYDGQMNDSRVNVGLACTAALAGASVLNHAEVVSLIRDDVTHRVIGARIRSNLSGKEFNTYAKVVVNAAGPFCDSVRKMADGTTDSPTSITALPKPQEDEIQFILDTITDYLNIKVRRTDVLSAWSGIRPLAMDPTAKNTENMSRDHIIIEDCPGLVTITGGKWTTYRSMAEDAVNAAIKSGKLKPSNDCVTQKLQIVGSYGWDPSSFAALAQQYVRVKKTHGGETVPGTMDTAAAKHLSHAYGSMADRVATIAQEEGLGKRLAHGHPFLEAEVAYCARNEYCESAVDFIARRCRIAFLDTNAAEQALKRVVEILASEHKWDKSRQMRELKMAKEFLQTFKSSDKAHLQQHEAS